MKTNSSRRKLKRGEPMRYWLGHNPRRKMEFDFHHSQCICKKPECQIPYGYCHCGCGQEVRIAKASNKRLGLYGGMPRRYVSGHSGSCHRGPLRPRIDMMFEGKEVTIIPLTQKSVVMIDREDEWKVPGNWFYSQGYARQFNPKTKGTVSMHRIIMDCPEDKFIDHINRNRKDNRKCNLRIVTILENSWNRGLRSDNTSGVTGVRFREDRNKWEVLICVEGELIYLGMFTEKDDAIKVRIEAEDRLLSKIRRK